MELKSLQESALWWHGPPWLAAAEWGWPAVVQSGEFVPVKAEDKSQKLKPDQEFTEIELVSHGCRESGSCFDLERFSSLLKLHQTTGWVFRFISKCRGKSKNQGKLTSEELETAQSFWLKRIQQNHFPEAFSHTSYNPSCFQALKPFIDQDGLLRCQGRLKDAKVPYETNNPILLPNKCRYTTLIIKECHNQVLHNGLKHTLARLRSEYWICRGHSEVKTVLKACHLCRKHAGGPFRVPDPPDLPSFRVQEMRPFSVVGLDYLGPLYIKSEQILRKVWVVLFTCSISRAVHLEVATDASTEQFLLSLRRFVANYGLPSLIISDNAKQFLTTERVLRRAVSKIHDASLIQDYILKNGISWKFITEMAPWMGGFYERMVGIVKTTLKKTVDKKCLDLVELQTVLTEISAITNTRPLLYDEDLPGEGILTPAMLLAKQSEPFPSLTDPREEPEPKSVVDRELKKHWKRIQAMIESFWSFWRKNYLTSLREQQSSHKQRNASEISPQVGAVVLIKDQLPRGRWRLGRITSLIPSTDGQVRSVLLKLASGRTLKRPMKLLFPLEVPNSEGPTEGGGSTAVTRMVPRRMAASRAQQRIKSLYGERMAVADVRSTEHH